MYPEKIHIKLKEVLDIRIKTTEFSSFIDYNLMLNDLQDIESLFYDYKDTFDIMFILDKFLQGTFPRHDLFKGSRSISRNKLESYGKRFRALHKLILFDEFFEKDGNITICNSFSELTYGYKLKSKYVKLYNRKYITKEYNVYKRDSFNEKRVYKKGDNIYKTKKELMQKEGLTKYEVNKNLGDYVHEIRSLVTARPDSYGGVNPNKIFKPSLVHEYMINNQNIDTFIDNFDYCENSDYALDVNIMGLASHEYTMGYTKLYYDRKTSGRLVNIGGEVGMKPLQNLPKVLRNVMFSGQYEYDINNCAPTLLAQLYKKYTKKSLPLVEDFGTKKEFYRKRLTDLGFTYNEAKEFYIAIFFGASLNTNFSKYSSYSWADTYGKDKIKYILENVPEVVSLYEEIRILVSELGFYLKKNHTQIKNGKLYLKNSRKSVKIFKDEDSWNNSKAIMHEYFGVESTILDKLIKKYTVNLCLYDAFISDKEYCTEEMSRLIKKETGFKVSLSKTLIEC